VRALVAGLVALVVVSGADAQGQRVAEPIEPGLALLAATVTYTADPFAERVRVYVGPRPWEGRSESAVVRCDPARQRVRLELGMLEVYLAEGQMVAVRRDNPRDVLVGAYQLPLTMVTLADLLPPIPAPGLALALDEDLDALAPYLPIRAWRRAELDPAGVTTLEGELAGGGQITAQLERSGRVGDIVAQVGEDRWVSIQASAAPAGDPAQWVIDPRGRRRVQSLADLAPARALRPGDAAPDLFFVDGKGQPWRLSEALEAGPVAVVLVRAGREGAMEAGRAGIEALRGRADVTTVLGVAYTMEAWSLEAVLRDRAALLGERAAEDDLGGEQAGGRGDSAGPHVALWSVSPEQTRDIAPGEPAAIVVIGADGTVRGVIAVADREAGAITVDLEAVVRDL
jgi:hypothetical protein